MTVDSLDYQTLLEQSIEELRLKTAAHDGIQLSVISYQLSVIRCMVGDKEVATNAFHQLVWCFTNVFNCSLFTVHC